MAEPPDGKKFENLYGCFNAIPACDKLTDRHLARAQSALMQRVAR